MEGNKMNELSQELQAKGLERKVIKYINIFKY